MNLISTVGVCASVSLIKCIFKKYQKRKKDYQDGRRIAHADKYSMAYTPDLTKEIIHKRFMYDQYNYNNHLDRIPSHDFIRGYNDAANELGIPTYKEIGPVGRMLFMGGYGMHTIANHDVIENSELTVFIPIYSETEIRFCVALKCENFEYDYWTDGSEIFRFPQQQVEFRINPYQISYNK